VKRVLVISYYYPPYGSVGATRVSKMTRYLADHGWTATVLTVSGDDRPDDAQVEIPQELIHRVPQLFDVTALPRSLLGRTRVEGRRFVPTRRWTSTLVWQMGLLYRNIVCFPDPQVGWLIPSVRKGLELVEDIRPDVILSSSFPNTSHLVACCVAARTKVPWIAEMRDLWTDNHNFRRIAPLRCLERQLERMVLIRANALVTVSDVWAKSLSERFGKLTYVVPNGFDPSDYAEPAPQPSGTFTLLYTGMFYQGKQDPDPLLHAIASLSRTGAITPQTFRLQLVGHYLAPILSRAEAIGVLPFVTADSPVPHCESLKRQRGAAALLFLDWADRRENGWYSAKIYEYLGAHRPILSVGPRSSVVATLLAASGAGVVGETTEDVRAVLEGWLREFQSTGGLACGSDPDSLRQYQRQTAAATMAGILDQYARR